MSLRKAAREKVAKFAMRDNRKLFTVEARLIPVVPLEYRNACAEKRTAFELRYRLARLEFVRNAR